MGGLHTHRGRGWRCCGDRPWGSRFLRYRSGRRTLGPPLREAGARVKVAVAATLSPASVASAWGHSRAHHAVPGAATSSRCALLWFRRRLLAAPTRWIGRGGGVLKLSTKPGAGSKADLLSETAVDGRAREPEGHRGGLFLLTTPLPARGEGQDGATL